MPVDQVLDLQYHAARVLLLVDEFSSRDSALDGLTKLVKLDFLLRYPEFLGRLLRRDGHEWPEHLQPSPAERLAVESRMIRYKYGPWDDRYYPILGYLVGTELAEFVSGQARVAIQLTNKGRATAARLRDSTAWRVVAARCALLKRHYNISGAALKSRIYRELPEVVDLAYRREIP